MSINAHEFVLPLFTYAFNKLNYYEIYQTNNNENKSIPGIRGSSTSPMIVLYGDLGIIEKPGFIISIRLSTKSFSLI
jgi:hypothetical protein